MSRNILTMQNTVSNGRRANRKRRKVLNCPKLFQWKKFSVDNGFLTKQLFLFYTSSPPLLTLNTRTEKFSTFNAEHFLVKLQNFYDFLAEHSFQFLEISFLWFGFCFLVLWPITPPQNFEIHFLHKSRKVDKTVKKPKGWREQSLPQREHDLLLFHRIIEK